MSERSSELLSTGVVTDVGGFLAWGRKIAR
jgi:hypothetical protein